jgi:hypothetical protein
MRCNFEMAVGDVVAFEGGRTVFAGEISHGPKFIPACDCELIVAGVPVAKFKIERGNDAVAQDARKRKPTCSLDGRES